MTKRQLNKILRQHGLWLSSNGEDGTRADLRGADLRKVNLSKADLRGANLSGANLYRANLSGADLSWANLHGADLSWANLSGADLFGANLIGANLSRANLSWANLYRAKGILVFQAGKHMAYATSAGIKIGCEWHDIPAWLEQYKAIGQKSRYTKAEIEDYGNFIKQTAKRLL